MTNLPPFGIAQTLLQLQILGYQTLDRVYIRCIAGKGFDIQADKLYLFDGYLTIKEQGFTFTRLLPQKKGGGEKFTTNDGYQYLISHNKKGYGVYLVVNAGGRKDEDITRCPALFYECDGVSKDEQWERLDRLPVKPSLTVETRNSLHNYYRTDEQTPDGWRALQQRLIQKMDADPANINPSRLLRLAGFYHQQKGLEQFPVTLQLASDAVYNRSLFDELLPTWDATRWSETFEAVSNEEIKQRLEAAKQRRELSLNNVDGFPLEICLSKDDRALIASGTGQGGRNHLGFKLASNLIATANWLNYTGYRYSDNERDLFEEYCDRCTPSISHKEREQIWRSASSSNPTPSLPDEAIENCIKAWQWKQLPESEKQASLSKSIGEPDPALYQQHLDKEVELEEIEKAEKLERNLYRFKQGLNEGTKKLKGKGSSKSENPQKIVSTPKVIKYDLKEGLPTHEQWEKCGKPIIEFDSKNRLGIYNDAINKGYAVHDSSFMGAGKSHGVPQLQNESGKIWYISQDHRNPSIPLIEEEFTDLMPRSKYGFYRDEQRKLRVATEETDPSLIEIKGNCIRADWFNLLANKGYNPNEKTEEGEINPICKTCPILGQCKSQSSWYLKQRSKALKFDKIREDIKSSPQKDYDYSNDIGVLEEPSRSLQPTKKLTSFYEQILIESDRLREQVLPSTYQYLDRLIQSLKSLATRKNHTQEEKRYGLTNESLKTALASHSNSGEIIDELDKIQLLGEIIIKPNGVDLSKSDYKKHKSLAKLCNNIFRKEAYQETKENLENLPPNALIFLLKFINGEKGIAARLNGEALILTIDDRSSYSPVLNSMKSVIFLDSTISTERLQKISGLERPIISIRQKINKPLDNLIVHNIQIEGLGSSTYSDTALKRVMAVKDAINKNAGYSIPIISLKAYQEQLGASGYWFVDNRGSNDFEGLENLIAVGSPNPNVGSVQDDYYALYGTLDSFNEYYAHLVSEEILQFTGRPRPHRYKDQQFHLWFINSGLDLDFLKEYGATIINQHGFELTPEAGNETQYKRLTILNTIHSLQQQGIKITQDAIANVVGVTQPAISQLFKNAGVTLSELVENIRQPIEDYNRSPYNPDNPAPDWFKSSYFRLLLELNPVELVQEFISEILNMRWAVFRDSILSFFPKPIQDKLESALIGLFIAENGLPETVFDTQ
ncbi:hypothetical protein C7H19_24465 [Aphanothece hegewaldii CCALA 016]|uniref:Uncharacterized protein n=1 Tax=Aphanothece hegewaldii CCALA 016 TaxID=2107694 RepID=A0A2T1LQN6_9CHRO|nr:hypothetical protein [Aphanothece hegewaldii]PSF29180.1 hypothetical protein C7H19_24465 [Aphanothece hegewaldii CCALA 016]